MRYVVFAQAQEPRVDLRGLIQNARRYFEATLEVLAEHGFEPGRPMPEQTRAELRLESSKHGYSASFNIIARHTTAADLAAAHSAEIRGRAAGMASLAERCAFIWDVEPEPGAPEVATLNLCALLASAALGPVMPDDASTLFGVRGAMERVERELRPK